MTAEEAGRRAARLLVPDLRLDRDPGDEVRRRAERALELGVGGFLLFGGEAGRVRTLVADLREAADRPLWMAADLERGAGQQFRGAVQLPPPSGLARAPDPVEAARAAGRITGREARRLGVDWALAPVVDLDVEPDNPIVGTRSFGADPAEVSRLAAAWIEGCQAEGVAACAKHFPGHGRTGSDSHVGLPRVEADAALLEREDLAPFRAVAPEVASVMTAHVAYPSLGSGGDAVPATLDPGLLEGVLRESLGFGGLVASDALTMEGFRGGTGDGGGRAAEAVRAGCDLLLCPRDLEAAVRGLAGRVAAGEDPVLARRVRESAARSRRVRSRLSARAGRDGRAASGAPGAGGPTGREALQLAVSCVTALGGEPGGGLDPGRPLGVVPVSDDLERPGEPEAFGRSFLREMERLGWSASRRGATGAGGARGGQRAVLLRSTPQAGKGRAAPPEALLGEVRGLLDAGGAAALVVFGHERALRAVGRAGLCAWSSERVMQRAAARALDERARSAG